MKAKSYKGWILKFDSLGGYTAIKKQSSIFAPTRVEIERAIDTAEETRRRWNKQQKNDK